MTGRSSESRTRLRSIAFGLYPAAFSVAFVVDEAVSNGVPLTAATRALPVAILVAAGTVLLGLLLTRHAGRGPILASALLLALVAGDGPLPLVFSAVILAVLYVDLRLTRRGGRSVPWTELNRGLTAMSIALAILVAFPTIGQSARAAPPGDPTTPIPGASKPDIFLVLLDGHGRPDVLAEHYGHDSGPFVRDLEGRGFAVATNSRSNQATTGVAMTTMLNSRHLADLGFSLTSSVEPRDVRPVLDANQAFDIVREAGYQTIAFSSGYELVSLRSADRFIDTGELNELELGLIGQTIIDPIFKSDFGDLKSQQIRARAIAMVPAINALAAETSNQPRFVVVHFPIPHPPFVLDRDCQPVGGGESYYIIGTDGKPAKPPARLAEETELTAGQTACAEKLAVQMVDGIVKGAGDDAVVVVFSDHGPDTRLNWFYPEAEPIRERVANFFAARTPGHPDLFPDDVTLVNVLPILFRSYVGVDLPNQPDTSYFNMPGVGLVDVESIGP